jgi:hypothetical protein
MISSLDDTLRHIGEFVGHHERHRFGNQLAQHAVG